MSEAGGDEPGGRWPRRGRLGVALVLVGIVLILAAAVAAVRPRPSALDLAGSDATKKGYLAAQEAVARAQAQADPTPAQGVLTGVALQQLLGELQQQTSQGVLVEADIRPTSLEMDQSPDPADTNFTTRIREIGFQTVSYLSAASRQINRTERQSFDTQAWLTQDRGMWVIADEHDSISPSTTWQEWLSTRGWPAIPVAAAGVVALIVGTVVAVPLRKAVRLVAPRDQTPATPAPLPGSHPEPAAPIATTVALNVRTFGALHLWADGVDLAPALLTRPIAGFIWLYLLVRDVDQPGIRMTRADLADEAFPGYAREAQRSRLRDRLTRMRRELPDQLGRRLVLDGDFVGLDMAGALVDAHELRELSQGTEMTKEQAPWLRKTEQILIETKGGFLNEWEEVARVTEGRGSSAERVANLRARTSSIRADLILAMSETLLARGESRRAASWLEEAMQARPDREDIGRLLVQALSESGQHDRAARFRRDYGNG